MLAACALVDRDTVINQRDMHRPTRTKYKRMLGTDEKRSYRRMCLDKSLIVQEVVGTAHWFVELIGGERAIFFALPPALADVLVTVFCATPTTSITSTVGDSAATVTSPMFATIIDIV